MLLEITPARLSLLNEQAQALFAAKNRKSLERCGLWQIFCTRYEIAVRPSVRVRRHLLHCHRVDADADGRRAEDGAEFLSFPPLLPFLLSFLPPKISEGERDQFWICQR